MAAEALKQWAAAESTAREQEARWPALQQLLIGICATHQELRMAAADTATSEVVDTAVQTLCRGYIRQPVFHPSQRLGQLQRVPLLL